jgi:sugar transferase (PEP-CTERM/EpsH1 system associated)
MEPLLYLTHRIPYPPNKGDKTRSYQLLRYLSARYRVHLGTFIDAPEDAAYVSQIAPLCASYKAVVIRPALARLRSLSGLLSGEALTIPYYRDASLAEWVNETVAKHTITRAVVFSSAMAQYVRGFGDLRTIVDFVDVDSAKWGQYAKRRSWPLSAIFSRECDQLLAFERAVAHSAEACVFVTAPEADLFCRLAPECAARVWHVTQGVDTDYFSPDRAFTNPYEQGEETVVFTGAMDYWPNVDAACWFAQQVLPRIVAARPRVRFCIAGMRPTAAVQELARDSRIFVTGAVPDIRPYLAHARAVVAPLRVAQGIQVKVLEALAMGRPAVISAGAARALAGTPGRHYAVARDTDEFAAATIALMNDSQSIAMGQAARELALSAYDWATNLAPFGALLEKMSSQSAPLAEHDIDKITA